MNRGHLNYKNEAELACVLDLAKIHGGPVLELACGAGRMSMQLAKEGYEVCAFDASLPMLEAGRRELQNHSKEIQNLISFLHADMTDFSLGKKFPLAVIAFCSFGYVLDTFKQAEETLLCILSHLEHGGAFFIDSPLCPLKEAKTHSYCPTDGARPYSYYVQMMEKWWDKVSLRYKILLTDVVYAPHHLVHAPSPYEMFQIDARINFDRCSVGRAFIGRKI